MEGHTCVHIGSHHMCSAVCGGWIEKEKHTRDSRLHGGHSLQRVHIHSKRLHPRGSLLHPSLRRQLNGSNLLQLRDERRRHLAPRKLRRLPRLRARRGGWRRPHGRPPRGCLLLERPLNTWRPKLRRWHRLLQPDMTHHRPLQGAAGVAHGQMQRARVARVHSLSGRGRHTVQEWAPLGTRGAHLLRWLHAGCPSERLELR